MNRNEIKIKNYKTDCLLHLKNESMPRAEDTLSWWRLCVLAGWRRCLHLLCVWKLCEKTSYEVLPALVLLPTVDEHFVLWDKKSKQWDLWKFMRAETQSRRQVLLCTDLKSIRHNFHNLFIWHHFTEHFTKRLDSAAIIYSLNAVQTDVTQRNFFSLPTFVPVLSKTAVINATSSMEAAAWCKTTCKIRQGMTYKEDLLFLFQSGTNSPSTKLNYIGRNTMNGS